MNQKFLQSMYHASVNIILMVENVTQIKNRTTINVDVSVKTMCAKNILFWNPTTCSFEHGKCLSVLLIIQ